MKILAFLNPKNAAIPSAPPEDRLQDIATLVAEVGLAHRTDKIKAAIKVSEILNMDVCTHQLKALKKFKSREDQSDSVETNYRIICELMRMSAYQARPNSDRVFIDALFEAIGKRNPGLPDYSDAA